MDSMKDRFKQAIWQNSIDEIRHLISIKNWGKPYIIHWRTSAHLRDNIEIHVANKLRRDLIA